MKRRATAKENSDAAARGEPLLSARKFSKRVAATGLGVVLEGKPRRTEPSARVSCRHPKRGVLRCV